MKTRVMYIVRNFPQITQTYIRTEIMALRDECEIAVISLHTPNVPYADPYPFREISDPFMLKEAIEEFKPHVLHGHYLDQAHIFSKLYQHGVDIPFTLRAHSFDTLGADSAIARAVAPIINDDLCLGVLSFPFTRPRLVEASINEDKIVDCFPPVNYPRFHDRTENGEAIMNVGAAIPKKNMEEFIDLASMVPNHKFSLYGVGHRIDMLKEYNRLKSDRVFISPPIEPDDMPAEYKKHRWMVYTASRQLSTVGWPMAIAEAQAAGVGVCMPHLRPDLHDFVGGAGVLYESIGDIVDLISGPVPEEMRELGFEQAKKSDIFEHKRLLTNLWPTIETPAEPDSGRDQARP
jgi:hypothetical protein